MNAPIYLVAKRSVQVLLLLGDPEPRLYPWGWNDDGKHPVVYPYAVFQVANGSPENFLAGRPDTDSVTLQVDVYAGTAASARAVQQALRDAIELDCYITSWRGESRDPETKSYRVGFDCDWIVPR